MTTTDTKSRQAPCVNGGEVVELVVCVGGSDGEQKKLAGRTAWALAELIRAGGGGVTAIERVGPRWSSYVHRLRLAGIAISTVDEKHGGAFKGSHARYVLAAPVTVVREVRA